MTSDHSLWCQNRDFRLFSFSRSSDDRDRYGELLVRSGHVFPVILPQEASQTVQKRLLELHFSDLPSQASRVSMPSSLKVAPFFGGAKWVPGGRPLGGGGGSNSQFCSTIRNMSVGRFQLALRALDLRAAPCPRGLLRPTGSVVKATSWPLTPPCHGSWLISAPARDTAWCGAAERATKRSGHSTGLLSKGSGWPAGEG